MPKTFVGATTSAAFARKLFLFCDGRHGQSHDSGLQITNQLVAEATLGIVGCPFASLSPIAVAECETSLVTPVGGLPWLK